MKEQLCVRNSEIIINNILIAVMCRWIIFLVPIFINTTALNRMETTFSRDVFTKKWGMACGAERLGPGWSESSDVSCAISCNSRYPLNFNSFMYNHLTKMCTPGSGLSPYQPPPSPSEGQLYLRDGCAAYLNFSTHTYNTSRAFAAYFHISVNYTQALTTCQCLDSQLFVAKSWDKYAIFASMANQQKKTWIGLSDQEVEGRFVWVDDGQVVDNKTKEQLFHAGYPRNAKENDDCVRASLYSSKYLLADDDCASKMPFVCEKLNTIC